MYKRILAAVDGSDISARALPEVIPLAGRFDPRQAATSERDYATRTAKP